MNKKVQLLRILKYLKDLLSIFWNFFPHFLHSIYHSYSLSFFYPELQLVSLDTSQCANKSLLVKIVFLFFISKLHTLAIDDNSNATGFTESFTYFMIYDIISICISNALEIVKKRREKSFHIWKCNLCSWKWIKKSLVNICSYCLLSVTTMIC